MYLTYLNFLFPLPLPLALLHIYKNSNSLLLTIILFYKNYLYLGDNF